MSSNFVFVLGRTPDLAFAELACFFPESSLKRILPHIVEYEHEINDTQDIINKLGGTVAIGKEVARLDSLTAESIAEIIDQNLSKSITFAITNLSIEPAHESFLRQIKGVLHQRGISSRYIVNKKTEPLSAIVVKGQHVDEFMVIKSNAQWIIVKTVAVQNIPEWVKRDYDRPCADPKRGMLPPKVARMVVNIASSFLPESDTKVLLDPFCGMGTVLSEALLSGWNVVGSDIVHEVVEKAKKNLTWLKREYPAISGTTSVIQSDAVHISKELTPSSVMAVVTEPFMGSTEFATDKLGDREGIKNAVRGLERLYIGCLREWKVVLIPGGSVLIALPSFNVDGRELFVKKVIDSCETLGYSIEGGPWNYGRPGAVVTRNFYLLKKR